MVTEKLTIEEDKETVFDTLVDLLENHSAEWGMTIEYDRKDSSITAETSNIWSTFNFEFKYLGDGEFKFEYDEAQNFNKVYEDFKYEMLGESPDSIVGKMRTGWKEAEQQAKSDTVNKNKLITEISNQTDLERDTVEEWGEGWFSSFLDDLQEQLKQKNVDFDNLENVDLVDVIRVKQLEELEEEISVFQDEDFDPETIRTTLGIDKSEITKESIAGILDFNEKQLFLNDSDIKQFKKTLQKLLGRAEEQQFTENFEVEDSNDQDGKVKELKSHWDQVQEMRFVCNACDNLWHVTPEEIEALSEGGLEAGNQFGELINFEGQSLKELADSNEKAKKLLGQRCPECRSTMIEKIPLNSEAEEIEDFSFEELISSK